MNNEIFTQVVTQRLEGVQATLLAKADEYARGDRLSNFKKIAAFRKKTPEEVLFGMVVKHIAALDDFIQDLDTGTIQAYPRWDEKIGDIMAYMILLDALAQERAEGREREQVERSIEHEGETR